MERGVKAKRGVLGMTAAICYRTQDNKYKTITVEMDGNPAFAGATLYAKYQKAERVVKLIELGDLLKVGEKLSPKSSIGHYILYSGDKEVEKRLQEGVCLSKYRDIHQITKNNVIKRNKKEKPRLYDNLTSVYICEGVDYIYSFDSENNNWSTWGIDYKTGYFKSLQIRYLPLIKNLIYRDDISELNDEEKENLKKIKF